MRISEALTANVKRVYNVPGNNIRIKDFSGVTTGALTIELYRQGQRVDVDLTGCDPGDYAIVPEGFDRLEITSTEAGTVTLQVARGRVNSDRISGSVYIIDGGRGLTLANNACISEAICAPSAGQYANVQLWNPSGSGKNVFIRKIDLTCLAAALCSMGYYNTALSTAQSRDYSKKNAGTAPVQQGRYESAASPVAGTLFKTMNIAAGTHQFSFVEPIMLAPNQGLLVRAEGPDIRIYASFETTQETA